MPTFPILHSLQKKSLELELSKNDVLPRKNDRKRCKQFTQALQKLKNPDTFSTGNGAKSGDYMACPKMLCRICRGVARQFSGKPKHRANQKNVNLLKHSKTPAPSTFAISDDCHYHLQTIATIIMFAAKEKVQNETISNLSF